MAFHLAYASWAHRNVGHRILGDVYRFPELADAVTWGAYGVQIFFTVSGFVIAFSASDAGAWGFLRSRILRLLPGALVCATITLIVCYFFDPRPLSELMWFWGNMVGFALWGPWLDTVYWTLGIEVMFYLVIFIMLASKGFGAIDRVAFAITLLSALANLAYAIFDPDHVIPQSSRAAQLLLLAHGVEFGTGIFLWLIVARGTTPLRLAGLSMGLVVGTAAILFDAVSLVPAIIYALSVLFIFVTARADRRLAAVLPPPVVRGIRALGLATYPLYLLHNVVGVAVMKVLSGLGVERFTALAIAALAMIALALLVTFTAERGVRMLLARLLPAALPARRAGAPG